MDGTTIAQLLLAALTLVAAWLPGERKHMVVRRREMK